MVGKDGKDTTDQPNGQATDTTVPGGHYVINNVHVDANGNEISADTPNSSNNSTKASK
jgi:hypothetical protein